MSLYLAAFTNNLYTEFVYLVDDYDHLTLLRSEFKTFNKIY